MWCPAGGMELSKMMSDRLVACYVTGIQSPKEVHLPIKMGGRWFCPGCGTQCHESQPGLVRCESCGKNMTGFLYQLIELHWHR